MPLRPLVLGFLLLAAATPGFAQLAPDQNPSARMGSGPATTGAVGTVDPASIRERMDVVSADGQRVGRVERVEGRELKLSGDDPQANGLAHFVPLDWVQSVEQGSVRLNKPTRQIRADWRTEGR